MCIGGGGGGSSAYLSGVLVKGGALLEVGRGLSADLAEIKGPYTLDQYAVGPWQL